MIMKDMNQPFFLFWKYFIEVIYFIRIFIIYVLLYRILCILLLLSNNYIY